MHFTPCEIGAMSGHKSSDRRMDTSYTNIHDVAKLEMVNCLYIFLNHDQELDEKIVNGIWRYADRLKKYYDKDVKDYAASERQKRIALLGSFDDYVMTQVIKNIMIYFKGSCRG